MAGIAGVCWLLAARAVLSKGGWRFAAYVFAAFATLMLMLGCASRQSDIRSLAVATGLVSILVGLGAPLLHRMGSEWVGMAALVVPTVLWVATYGTFRPGRLPDAAVPLARAEPVDRTLGLPRGGIHASHSAWAGRIDRPLAVRGGGLLTDPGHDEHGGRPVCDDGVA